MADRYVEICDQLLELVHPGFGGRPNPRLIEEITGLAAEAMRLAGDSYIDEKGRRLIHWAKIACSVRRHKPWGLQRVEQNAYSAAYTLRHNAFRAGRDD